MEVIPAIDVMGGRCVQLVGGDPATMRDFGDPLERALQWKRLGARMLHVVDLDAALGRGGNFDTILKLRGAAGLPIEFGGGIRSVDAARSALSSLEEEDRIILGTLAVADYPGFKSLKALKAHRDRLIVSVDSKGGYVAVKGWTKKSQVTAPQMMAACSDHVWGFLYTDVDVEGRMEGINSKKVEDVVSVAKKPVIVSGGVSSKTDVEACRKAGAWGIVLGKALYEGRIRLEEAI
jgi:phosphoribosylformimino-5-aminoimidazole carboxamide ribotide isomerase